LVQEAMDRLQPDKEGFGLPRAELVIEAVFEKLEVKRAVLAQIEIAAQPRAIIATNTSSIPLADLAPALKQPERLLGLHFFNPVAKMPLVEVVYGEKTQASRVNDAMRWVLKIHRSPLRVKSSPGFLVNRVLMPYLVEALRLLDEGHSVETVDQIALEFGMPMGPVSLADTVGLDVCLSVAQNLTTAYGGAIPVRLAQKVQLSQYGVKAGQGFYTYRRGHKMHPAERLLGANPATPVADILDRLMLIMVNEAVACFQEQVISSWDEVDAGIIFGTGFAPFRGGPIQYVRTRGVAAVLNRLEELAAQYGDRFKPKAGWELLK
jgi:3-hydroxyacyl-CoA dehydrogenase/enoyl-CoA hydratase/3-hydroxybutyryl-CoA epimerase